LKAGLEEGIAHAKGEITLKTVELPEKPPTVDARTLAALREAAQMSQTLFAKVMNVSPKTIQSWEQGTRVPSMASRRLIQVFSQRPEVVCEIVGVQPVVLPGVRIVQSSNGERKIEFSRNKYSRKK
jgi:putative transcriptional regulator